MQLVEITQISASSDLARLISIACLVVPPDLSCKVNSLCPPNGSTRD
ncbi:hypothetical protein AVDCRST_MAG81-2287 [uncultured Synechococcales cyanobacterium]|uniref:Uncharacterized protein n=1 Tax=uncultured Synechococcales cyanobacterium TaxID=1936017 RepID=A0A6J4VJR7_9CYAN|nr:hypothetical protein AVDCRST_MAG81-2287 [uncultured Synechococcales cyanobacterium]